MLVHLVPAEIQDVLILQLAVCQTPGTCMKTDSQQEGQARNKATLK